MCKSGVVYEMNENEDWLQRQGHSTRWGRERSCLKKCADMRGKGRESRKLVVSGPKKQSRAFMLEKTVP